MATKEEELEFWRDVGKNLLTDNQLDARMPHTGKTPREVLTPETNHVFLVSCVEGGWGWGHAGDKKRLVMSGANQQVAEHKARSRVPGGWDIKYVGTTQDKEGIYDVNPFSSHLFEGKET